ncbi:MAG: VWA domain-containing protein [Gammaproteobacteria bacterium]
MRYFGERHTGVRQPEPGIYLDTVRAERDLACLIMADLSLSTDAWISNTQRVVDVIRDSLLQLAEALSATGDVYAMYGFSSLKRQLVRLHVLKEFNESYDGNTRGRVQALKPGYYTRMGAALRFATRVLNERGNALRLLILLTDGKPNDIDHYEGRYAIEDTAAAVREARRAGLRPFCVTIDQEAADYLPRIFGAQGHIVVQRPEDLPGRLPKLYAQLTAS